MFALDYDGQHQQRTRDALLGERTYIFAVGVTHVAVVGADDRHHIRPLVGAVDELVGTRADTRQGLLLPHADGGAPAVEAFQVRGVGGDIGDGLHLVGQRERRVLLVLAQLIHDVVLEGQEEAQQHGGAQRKPAETHTEAHESIDKDGSHHADPRRTAVAEPQTHKQQAQQPHRHDALPQQRLGLEGKVNRQRQHQGDDAAIGCVIVVEGAHHMVQHLQVAVALHGIDSGDDDNHRQRQRIGPIEKPEVPDFLETLRRGVEERYDEPQAHGGVLEALHRLERHDGGEHHPHQRQHDEDAHRVAQHALVVAVHQQLLEEEHHREDNHHRLHGHREAHVAYEGIVDGKGCEQRHQRQALVAVHHEEPHHQHGGRHQQDEIVLVEQVVHGHTQEQGGEQQSSNNALVGRQFIYKRTHDGTSTLIPRPLSC